MFFVLRTFTFYILVVVMAAPVLAWGPFEIAELEDVSAIRWASKPIIISISSSLNDNAPNIKLGSDVEKAIENCINSWRPFLDVEIVTQRTDAQNVSPRGRSGDSINLITIAPTQANSYLFARDSQTPAKTRLFYSSRTQIIESDIVLNPALQFSTDGTFGTFDLESVLRHEFGHLLGLDHTSVPGSIMYEKIARNGVGKQASELSQIDVAAIRELYGQASTDGNCCGSIDGKITSTIKSGTEIEIWAVDSTSGEMAGMTSLAKNRTFSIGGLTDGVYRLYARSNGSANGTSQQDLGEFEVKGGISARAVSKFTLKPFKPRITSIGSNGFLSDQAISLTPDSTTSIFIGGDLISQSRLRLEVDSPFISVESGSVSILDYSDETDALSLRISVSPQTPPGNYSICVIDSNDARSCLLGGIRVTK